MLRRQRDADAAARALAPENGEGTAGLAPILATIPEATVVQRDRQSFPS